MLILHYMLISLALISFLISAFGIPPLPVEKRWQFIALGLAAWLASTVIPYAAR